MADKVVVVAIVAIVCMVIATMYAIKKNYRENKALKRYTL